MRYNYAIIGGGASGLMLAALVDLNKCKATGVIYEATSVLGSKILMSGGGRCNITHDGSIKDFLQAYGEAGKFLRKSLYKHNNLELIRWLEQELPTVSEEGRVFPAGFKASDVLNFLLKRVKSNGWTIQSGCKIARLEEVDADDIIVACGGITYPETGSDGSMLKILAEIGVNIVEPRSALAPIKIKDYPYSQLAGISVKDVTVSIEGSGKTHRCSGDILFTHNGFSGPAVLNISKYAAPGDRISINYRKRPEELPKRLYKAIEERSRGASGDIRTKALSRMLENDFFTVGSVDSRGMVTHGGVALSEINPATMELRPHLYAIGEVIDADGITGGYNLQMCYSTAATVADTILKARSEQES